MSDGGGGGVGGAAASRCLVRANAAIDLANSPLHIRYGRIASLACCRSMLYQFPPCTSSLELAERRNQRYIELFTKHVLSFLVHFQTTHTRMASHLHVFL